MLLETYYEGHRAELTAVLARYSGDREAAEDAVQEAFLRALQNRELLSDFGEKSLWAWLYSTAKNALTDEKRKSFRAQLTEDMEDFDGADPDDPIDALLIRDLLHKLPENLRQVVSLRYFGGLNASEIGRMRGIPASTVRSQLRTALGILRKYV